MSVFEELTKDIREAIKKSRKGLGFTTWFQESLPSSVNITESRVYHVPEGYDLSFSPRDHKIERKDVKTPINFKTPINLEELKNQALSYSDLVKTIEQIYRSREQKILFEYLKERITKVQIENFDVRALGEIMEYTEVPPTKIFMKRSRNLLKILNFLSEFHMREGDFISIVSGLEEKEFITGAVDRINILYSEPQIRINNNGALIKSSFIVYAPPSRLKELVLVDFSEVQ